MRNLLRAGISLVFLVSVPLYGDILTFDITACVDGESQLILQQNTLQWRNISWRVPGNTVDCPANPSTIISTTLNGTPVLSNVAWTPTWAPGELTDPFAVNVYSSTFTGLSPLAPVAPDWVVLDPVQARWSLTLVQQPTTANGGALVLDFNDATPSGPSIYEGLVTIGTDGAPEPPPPDLTPEPSNKLFLGIATLALLLAGSRSYRQAFPR